MVLHEFKLGKQNENDEYFITIGEINIAYIKYIHEDVYGTPRIQKGIHVYFPICGDTLIFNYDLSIDDVIEKILDVYKKLLTKIVKEL